MASALALTATNTISNGHGLAPSANVVSLISSFQLLNSVRYVANIFTNISNSNANVSSNLYPIVNTLGSGALYGQWLLDFYPYYSTAKCSGTVYNYGNTSNTASVSHTLSNQVNYPFANGLAGFANVYQSSNAYALNNLDTVSSAKILQTKTYAQSGLGYTGPGDLATGGIGANGAVLANVVANWGTMYDINNIANFSDPYVFGQNLLNQGMGKYGNLNDQFTAVGLNIADITAPPSPNTSTTQSTSTVGVPTAVGVVNLATVNITTNQNNTTGSSPDVVAQIYQSVTGANLAVITATTGITTTDAVDTISSLNDYLNFNKVIDKSLIAKLAKIGITDFPSLSAYLQKTVGKGSFSSWAQMGSFFASINSPAFSTTQNTDPNAPVLSSAVASSILTSTTTGSGPLGNPIMIDFLGAAAGIPYTANIATLIKSYPQIASPVESALGVLDSAVANYIFVSNASTSAVSAAVVSVNSQLTSLANTSAVWTAQQAYFNILTRLSTEVTNLTAAGATNASVGSGGLANFAQGFISSATDTALVNSAQVLSQLITTDSYGDTLHAAIAENANSSLFASVGLTLDNDPKPVQAMVQSQQQNVPISTYLTQHQ